MLSLSGRAGCAAVLGSLALLGCSSTDKATPGENGSGGAGVGGGASSSGGANLGGASTGDAGPALPPGAADWPMYAHDLASNYWNQGERKISVASAPNLTQAWVVDTGGLVTGTPAIVGNRVYVVSAGAYALDLASGSQIWKNPDITSYSSPAVDNGVVYIHDQGSAVHALDATTGHEIWKHDAEVSGLIGFSSPVVTKDYVIVGASGGEEVSIAKGQMAKTRGFILALNKKDGTVAWKQFTVDPPSTGVGVWSTVSVDETAGLVVAGSGNTYTGTASPTGDAFLGMPLAGSGIQAMTETAATAKLLWHPQILTDDVWVQSDPHGPDGDFGANPILYETGGKKLAAGGDKVGDVFIIDRTTGAILKQRNLGPGMMLYGGVFVSGAWDGKNLYFAANRASSTGAGSEAPDGSGIMGALFALDPLTLDVKWERQYNGTAWGPISLANGVGFFGILTKLQAFNTDTGAVLNEFVPPTAGTIGTAPAVSNGYVVFGSGMTYYGTTGGTKYYALKVP